MKKPLALLAALLLAACASAERGPPVSTPDGPAAGKGGSPAAKPDPGAPGTPELATEGRSLLYQRLDSMTRSWQVASASPGETAAQDARALESAIGREVWKEMATVLGDLAGSDNPRWRATAARGLGFVADPRVAPALVAVLREPDVRLLNSALVSLARLGDVSIDTAAVAPHLRAADPVLRGNAALCLARVFQSRRRQGMEPAPGAAEPELEADLAILLFDREDPIVRGNAAQALGALASPGAEDALLNRLRDEAAFVRLKTAQALALAGTPKSYGPLLDALGREGEGNVRTILALALGSIAEREGKTPPHADLGTDAPKWRKWLGR